jgi:hypothetical protein
LLAHFYCSLLINSPLGINLQWISTDDNKITNDMSCLKKHSDTNSAPNFDYTTLKQTYPELNHCSFFLSDSARAHLHNMDDSVDQEMAKSRGGPDVETEAAWQAHYIKWAEIIRIQDPCGYYPGYQRIMAIYTKYVQKGVNYNNKQALRSATVRGFAKVVNTLFKLRGFAPPANLSDLSNMISILINNMLRKEDIARQHAPLDNLTTKSLLSCDVLLLLVRIVIRLITFSSTLYLSVITSVPV